MPTPVERVQTGIRIEKRTLKVLKALAEYLDLSLGDLLEGVVLHAFEGQAPFGGESLAQITRLKDVYGLTLTAADSHLLAEAPVKRPQGKRPLTRRARAGGRPSGRARSRGKTGRRKTRATAA
jgi:hypothetical protein